jgi:peptide/nickel transport system substrate-binding protein
VKDSDGDGVPDNLDEFKDKDDELFKKTLYLAAYYEPQNVDPAFSVSGSLVVCTRNMYETLVRFKSNTLELEPWLATDWEISSDGLTYTFTLREDVLYSDGTPMNASSVAFGFNRCISYGAGAAGKFTMIDTVEAIDDYVVQFNLKAPFGPFIRYLADKFGNQIVSPSAVEKHKTADDPEAHDWIAENSAGTGPYMFDSWDRNERWVMVKNPLYWQGWGPDSKWGENHIERIEMQLLREASTNKQVLMAGDVDQCEQMLIDDWAELDALPEIIAYIPELKVNGLMFTLCTTIPPTDNIYIREAMEYAFNYEIVRDQISVGYAEIGNSIVPRPVYGHNPDLPPFEQDLDRAHAAMVKAGYPTGVADPPLKCKGLTPLGDPYRKQCIVQAQSDWKEIGIDLEIIEEPSSASWAKYIVDDYDYNFNTLGLYGESDADGFLWPDTHSSSTPYRGRGWNQGNITDPYLDDLLERSRAESDPDKRLKLLHEAQAWIRDNHYFITVSFMPEALNRCRRSWLKTHDIGFLYHPALWRTQWWYGMYKQGDPGAEYGY